MRDIRVGEPEIIRRVPRSAFNSLLQCPQFAGPSRLERRRGKNLNRVSASSGFGGLPSQCRGIVLAVIIYNDHAQFATVILSRERLNGLCNRFRFIARWNQGKNAWPAAWRLMPRNIIVKRV